MSGAGLVAGLGYDDAGSVEDLVWTEKPEASRTDLPADFFRAPNPIIMEHISAFDSKYFNSDYETLSEDAKTDYALIEKMMDLNPRGRITDQTKTAFRILNERLGL